MKAATLALALALAACAGGGGGGAPRSAGETVGDVTVGRAIPDLSLRDLDGNEARLSSYQGKVVLLDVWASWCEPCKEELPMLDKLAVDLRGRGVEVLAVSVDQEVDNVQRFLRKRGGRWNLKVFHDPSGQVAERLQPPKMPTSYVVDRAGVVRHVNVGFERADVRSIRARLEELSR